MDIWAKTKRNICALNSGFGAAVRISLRRFFKRIFRKKKERVGEKLFWAARLLIGFCAGDGYIFDGGKWSTQKKLMAIAPAIRAVYVAKQTHLLNIRLYIYIN